MSLRNKVTYAVTRKATGSYPNGVYAEGPTTNFNITGNCQPVSGDEILQIAEGDRKKQILKLYSSTELRKNDVVTVDNKPFEANPVEDWTRQGRLQHYKIILILKDT